MPQENSLIDEQEITVDFDITEDINIELGKVYEGGPSGGTIATNIEISIVQVT